MAASDVTRLVAAAHRSEFWRCYVYDAGDGFDVAAEGGHLAEQFNSQLCGCR